MKKYILALAALAGLSGAMNAQSGDPNRLLVTDQNDMFTAFNLGNVKQIEFATVEGEVAANVDIISSSRTKVTVSVTRTPECQSFIFNIVPGVIARQLADNPSNAASYLKSTGGQVYYEDFSSGEITGFEPLDYDTEYAVVTVGADSYNVYCNVCAAYFTTEKAPITGDPKVDVQVVNAGLNSLDLHFTPNADTKEYYFVIFEKGQAQSQYEQFAPMFGCTSMGQFIMRLSGSGRTEAIDYQYTDLAPNTDYELYVQPLDKNGNRAELQIFPMSTLKQGGSGAAYVEIALGEYKLADWDGQMKPSQFVTYTPNDQTWCYRFGVYPEEQFDANVDEIKANIAGEPPVPNMAYWFFYETLTTDYQLDPNTKFVVIAAAKNADGNWGEFNILRATTPVTVSGAPAMKARALNGPAKVASRFTPAVRTSRPGMAPSYPTIILSH